MPRHCGPGPSIRIVLAKNAQGLERLDCSNLSIRALRQDDWTVRLQLNCVAGYEIDHGSVTHLSQYTSNHPTVPTHRHAAPDQSLKTLSRECD